MVCQSQLHQGSVKKCKKRASRYKQTGFGNRETFVPSKDCWQCVEFRRWKQGLRGEPKKGHHPRCPRNQETKRRSAQTIEQLESTQAETNGFIFRLPSHMPSSSDEESSTAEQLESTVEGQQMRRNVAAQTQQAQPTNLQVLLSGASPAMPTNVVGIVPNQLLLASAGICFAHFPFRCQRFSKVLEMRLQGKPMRGRPPKSGNPDHDPGCPMTYTPHCFS